MWSRLWPCLLPATARSDSLLGGMSCRQLSTCGRGYTAGMGGIPTHGSVWSSDEGGEYSKIMGFLVTTTWKILVTSEVSKMAT